MLSRAFERRDDIARIEASGGGLETRHDAARRGPAFGGVTELGPGPALRLFALGAAHAEIVGDTADLGMQHVVPGEPEDVIDAVRLAPSHCLGTGIVAIATPADAGLGPMPTDVAGHVPDDGTDFGPARRLAFAQDDGDRLAGTGFVYVDRQEAALVIMCIEERELLVPMDPVERVVDVECDRGGRARPTRAEQIDHGGHHPRDLDLRWRVLQPRHGRLRAQRIAALRQPSHGQLEHRIAAQRVAVVRVLIARRDQEHPQPQHRDEIVIDAGGIAPILQASGQKLGESNPPLDIAQQHHAAIRRQKPAVKGDTHFLAANRWQGKRQKVIFVHGGGGAP